MLIIKLLLLLQKFYEFDSIFLYKLVYFMKIDDDDDDDVKSIRIGDVTLFFLNL